MNSCDPSLNAGDLADLQATVLSLLTGGVHGTAITWQAKGGRTFNPGAGRVANNDVSTPITAFLGPLSVKEVRDIQGAKTGDIRVLIPFASLSAAPTTEDRFTIGSVAWAVWAVETSPLPTHFSALARRV